MIIHRFDESNSILLQFIQNLEMLIFKKIECDIEEILNEYERF